MTILERDIRRSAPEGDCGAANCELADARAAFKRRMVAGAAAICAARGWRRVALYAAGRHTRLFIRQPWIWHGVTVVAVIDDEPKVKMISGTPVMRPCELGASVDAVIVSSDTYEAAIAARAEAVFGPLGVPVLRIYGDEPTWEDDAAAVRRLVDTCGVSRADAVWLVANRTERHDATLPVLAPERTELHLRRYEFAAEMVRGKRVLDAACGVGYGSSLLMRHGGAAGVVGVDIDARTIAYAGRRFGAPGIEFRVASATATGLPDASVDVVTSFETIEHMAEPERLLAEFARVLAPGGRLLLSTPNDWGLTDFHAHSFTPEEFREMVERTFRPLAWFGQRAGDVPAQDGLPAGMFRMDDACWRAETLMVVGEKKERREARAIT